MPSGKSVDHNQLNQELIDTQRYPFSASITKKTMHIPEMPGVYAIWASDNQANKIPLYVGHAGEGKSKKLRGLKDRLGSHRRGTFTATSLAIAIWFRLIASKLELTKHKDIADLRLDPSNETREYIRKHLSYSFVQTSTKQQALELEAHIHSKHPDLLLNNFRKQARANAAKSKKEDDEIETQS